MTINIFKKKLLYLVESKQLSNEELNFIKLFNSDEELFEWSITLDNDSDINLINKKNKSIFKYKKVATHFMNKINNTDTQ